jgi:autotransporter-associated beta strand protein
MNEKLTAYALNELPPDERAELEAQMENDPALREQAEDMKAFCAMLSEQVAGDEAPELTPQQRVSVMRAFNDETPARRVSKPFWQRPSFFVPATLAACIAFMLGWGYHLTETEYKAASLASKQASEEVAVVLEPAPRKAPASFAPRPAPAAPAKPQIAAAPVPPLPGLSAPLTDSAPAPVSDPRPATALAAAAAPAAPAAIPAVATASAAKAKMALGNASSVRPTVTAGSTLSLESKVTVNAPTTVAGSSVIRFDAIAADTSASNSGNRSYFKMLGFTDTVGGISDYTASGVIEFSDQLGQYRGSVPTRSAEGRDFPLDFVNRYGIRQSEWTVSKIDDAAPRASFHVPMFETSWGYAAEPRLFQSQTFVASQLQTVNGWATFDREAEDLDTTVAGGIGGATGLVKSGSGTWVLNGLNTYTGGTTVAGGTVAVTPDGWRGTSEVFKDLNEPATASTRELKVAEVERQLTRGHGHLSAGDYDKSIASFQEALRVDPYNAAARRGMEKAEQKRSQYFDTARDHVRARMLAEVDRGWEDPIPASLLAASRMDGTLALGESARGGSLEITADVGLETAGRRNQKANETVGALTHDLTILQRNESGALEITATVLDAPASGNRTAGTLDASGTVTPVLPFDDNYRRAVNSYGDFDTGIANARETPYVNKPDEGNFFANGIAGSGDITINSLNFSGFGRMYTLSEVGKETVTLGDSATALRYADAGRTDTRKVPVNSANLGSTVGNNSGSNNRVGILGSWATDSSDLVKKSEAAKLDNSGFSSTIGALSFDNSRAAGGDVAVATTGGLQVGQAMTGTGVRTGTGNITITAGATLNPAGSGVVEQLEAESLSAAPIARSAGANLTIVGGGRVVISGTTANTYTGNTDAYKTLEMGANITTPSESSLTKGGAGTLTLSGASGIGGGKLRSKSDATKDLNGNVTPGANDFTITAAGVPAASTSFAGNVSGNVAFRQSPKSEAAASQPMPPPPPGTVPFTTDGGALDVFGGAPASPQPTLTVTGGSTASAPNAPKAQAATWTGTTTVNQGTLTLGTPSPAQGPAVAVAAGKQQEYFRRDSLATQMQTRTEQRVTAAREFESRVIADKLSIANPAPAAAAAPGTGATLELKGANTITGGVTIANGNPPGITSGNRSGRVAIVPDSIDGLLVITTPAATPAPGTPGSVPILGDIPIQGRLFQASGGELEKLRREKELRDREIDAIERVQELNRQRELALQRRVTSGESYIPIYENPFLFVGQQPLSTFSIDVDSASYANVRRFLNIGQRPPVDAVRLEELINYFPYTYEGPADAKPFGVMVDVAEAPWQPLHRLVRVGIKGREVSQERGAANFVFLVDVSGSMGSPDKLELVKRSLEMLTRQINTTDRVAIVTYAGTSGLALPSTAGTDKDTILNVIHQLTAGGSTNGASGITLAYQEAAKHFVPGGVNRVILCTDGDFNVGISSDAELEELITEKAKSRIFLSVLGFGTGNLKDSKMETLADKGNGNYAYIDSLSEARKVLVEQMNGTLVTIAKDVKIQVEFNPAQVAAYRLLGYENRLMAKEDFNNDKKDAGEIGAGHTVTALYEVVPATLKFPDGRPAVDELKYASKPKLGAPLPAEPAPAATPAPATQEMMTVKLRYKQPEGDKSDLLEVPVTDKEKKLAESPGDFQFAASVAGFGMLLRGSQYSGELTWDMVREMALKGKGEDAQGYRGEFLQLIDKARGLTEQRR